MALGFEAERGAMETVVGHAFAALTKATNRLAAFEQAAQQKLDADDAAADADTQRALIDEALAERLRLEQEEGRLQ
jgi:hypothetical protein